LEYRLNFALIQGTPYIYAERLLREKAILVLFTTRQGGVSKAPFDTLNLAEHVGDDLAAVKKNRQRVCSHFGLNLNKFTYVRQIHSCQIVKVENSGRTSGFADGLITTVKNLPIAVFVADCVPIVLINVKQRQIAVVHAGWRGTLGRIVEVGLAQILTQRSKKMENLKEVYAYLGPAICAHCYEVSPDLIQLFKQKFPQYKTWPCGNKIDLVALNRWQLLQAGVREENIYTSGFCTACRPDLFFSYRASGKRTGRQGAIGVLL
jgi:hypothetical protein